MKQLFLGAFIWVIVSSAIFLLFGFFTSSETIMQDTEIVNEQINNNKEANIWENNTVVVEDNSEEHKIAVNYIENNMNVLLDDIDTFMQDSPYPFAAALYAIKHKKVDLWNTYWLSLYESLDEIAIEKEVYVSKLEEAFQDIQTDSLNKDDYLPYLLDGAIYFSNETLDSKKELCTNAFLDMEGDSVPNDAIEYCQSISYVFEAMREDDVSLCSQISYIPEDTALIENCKSLFE